jgi:hypothetical protein
VDSVLKELMRYWRHFIETDIAKAYRDEVTKFEKWLKEMGLSPPVSKGAGSLRKRETQWLETTHCEYIKGLIRRGQTKILVNMFAAYLVHRGLATQYWLIKEQTRRRRRIHSHLATAP